MCVKEECIQIHRIYSGRIFLNTITWKMVHGMHLVTQSFISWFFGELFLIDPVLENQFLVNWHTAPFLDSDKWDHGQVGYWHLGFTTLSACGLRCPPWNLCQRMDGIPFFKGRKVTGQGQLQTKSQLLSSFWLTVSPFLLGTQRTWLSLGDVLVCEYVGYLLKITRHRGRDTEFSC